MRARLTLHLAARVLSRSRGRNALITAMIALPVIALVAFGTVFASTNGTPRESLGFELGRTQALVTASGNGRVKQNPVDVSVVTGFSRDGDEQHDFDDPAPYLPAGAQTIRIDRTHVTAKTATGLGSLYAVIGRSWDPLLEGRYTVVSGRTPTAPDEAMVTASTLERLGVRVGQTASLTQPTTHDYVIVGVLDDEQVPSSLEEIFVSTAPTAAGTLDGLELSDSTSWYVTGTPLSWADVQSLNRVGAIALSRAVVLHPPAVIDADIRAATVDRGMGRFWQSILVLVFGVFALLQVALLAAAAFMVGARQQERTLAILGSVGADRRLIRSVVSLGGLLLGVLGAAVGVALGVPLGWLVISLTRDGSASQYPGFHVDPLITGAIVVIAIGFSWIASAIPARSASRIDVVAALRGATRPVPPRRRTPVIGVVLVTLGCALCVTGGVLFGVFSTSSDPIKVALMLGATILGPIVILVGVIFTGPTILRGVSRILSLGGVGARLASRDAARNSARTVPAIAAVISTVFVAAFGACAVASLQQTQVLSHQYQSAMNQVNLSLVEYTDGKQPTLYAPAPLVSALADSFDLTTVRVIASAGPEKTGDETKDGPLVVEAAEQSRFLCAWDPRQPNPTTFVPSERDAAHECENQPSIMGSFSTSGYDSKIIIGDANDLAMLLGEKPSPAARAALADGRAVSLYPQYLSTTGAVTLNWWPAAGDRGYDGGKPDRSTAVSAVLQRPAHDLPYSLVISPETAASLGIPIARTTILGNLASPATTAQKDAATKAVGAITGAEYPQVTVESGADDFGSPVTLVLLLISTMVSLAASIAAIGLARSDGRRDDAILGAVGAPPLLRRSFGFWQAIIIAGVGSIIGVLLGIAEFAALTIPKYTGTTGGLDPAAPIVPLLVITVAIPAVIAIGAWLGTRRGRTSVLDRSVIA